MSGDENKIDGAINAMANLSKAIPVYEDAIQPLARQTGKALGTIGECVNAVLLPVEGFVWGAEQIKAWLRDKVTTKLSEKEKDEIVSPSLSILGPTIEALKYRGHESEISEMFANLLAHDMLQEEKASLHPIFVEAIKALTPIEARLFGACIDMKIVPVAGFQLKNDKEQGETLVLYPFNSDVVTAASLGKSIDISVWQSSIENLERVGLVKMDLTRFFASEEMSEWYKNAEQHPIVIARREKLLENQSLNIIKGCLDITQMGRNFAKVALRSP